MQPADRLSKWQCMHAIRFAMMSHSSAISGWLRPACARRLFRVVPARTFLDSFASDRSHMIRADRSWIAPPPTYPAIRPVQGSSCQPHQTMNLHQYFTMTAPSSPQHPTLSHAHSPVDGGAHVTDSSLASGARSQSRADPELGLVLTQTQLMEHCGAGFSA